MKQTSIEWLIDQMFKQGYFDGNKPLTYTNLDHLQQQAKQMHKEEIVRGCVRGCVRGYLQSSQEIHFPLEDAKDYAEQYYNETYGGNYE